MNMRFLTVGLIAGASFLSSLNALAGTASAPFDVTLTIDGACTVTALDIDFGSNTGGIAAIMDSDGQVNVTCTTGEDYTVGMTVGAGAGATYSARKMTNPADSSTVNYSLYTDAVRSTVWTETTGGVLSGTGNGAVQSYPVYGRVPSPQANVTVGTYRDTVVVKVEF